MSPKNESPIVHTERIERSILSIRGHRVMLDADLAELYGVTTSRLNEQVTRNKDRFPDDFAFRLTRVEWTNLKSQNAMSSSWGGRRSPPRVFTEQGVAMLSSVLKSGRAVEVNIAIMRTFVRLRAILASNGELARRLAELELKHDKHDRQIRAVFDAIRQLMEGLPVKRIEVKGFGKK